MFAYSCYTVCMNTMITVDAHIAAPIEKVWDEYTRPESIKQWNAASEDWYCPHAENDLRIGGRFVSRMEAKDGSEGFDFSGTYTDVKVNEMISYVMDDDRAVSIYFKEEGAGTHVVETFDPENVYPHEYQKAGWQSILDNFKQHVETH